jgi:hypothetical protein
LEDFSMSTPEERLAAIQANYDDASDNETDDLAKAQTPADVAAIQANVAAARSAYYSAEAAMLTQNGANVENAYQAALAAQKSVTDARSQAASIADLITKLSGATTAANSLLSAAKS